MAKAPEKATLVPALGVKLTPKQRERVLAYVAKKKPKKRSHR